MKNSSNNKLNLTELERNSLLKIIGGSLIDTEILEFKQGNDRVVRKKPGRTT